MAKPEDELNGLQKISRLYFKLDKTTEGGKEYYDLCAFIENCLSEHQKLEAQSIIYQIREPKEYGREIYSIGRIRNLYKELQTKEIMQEFHSLIMFVEDRLRYYQIQEMNDVAIQSAAMDRRSLFEPNDNLIH
ncbi:MAG TPA: hypothetical protein PK821_04855 [Victivallales bacterium]|nr:hypothetical protein [Victivallales bacterium]